MCSNMSSLFYRSWQHRCSSAVTLLNLNQSLQKGHCKLQNNDNHQHADGQYLRQCFATLKHVMMTLSMQWHMRGRSQWEVRDTTAADVTKPTHRITVGRSVLGKSCINELSSAWKRHSVAYFSTKNEGTFSRKKEKQDKNQLDKGTYVCNGKPLCCLKPCCTGNTGFPGLNQLVWTDGH